MKLRVGIFIFDQVEVLDFAGPFEVFATAKQGEIHLYEVFTVGLTDENIKTFGGMQIEPNYTINNCPTLDIFILPGAEDISFPSLSNSKTFDWIRKQNSSNTLILSICTGAFVLARIGLLNGLTAATHPSENQNFALEFPQLALRKDARFVDNGKILCSAGVSSGIDLALYVLEREHGKKVAQQVAERMDYIPRKNSII